MIILLWLAILAFVIWSKISEHSSEGCGFLVLFIGAIAGAIVMPGLGYIILIIIAIVWLINWSFKK